MPLIDYEARLERTVNSSLNNGKISDENKDLFEDFLRHLRLQDYSPSHIEKYLSPTKQIMEPVDFELRDAKGIYHFL